MKSTLLLMMCMLPFSLNFVSEYDFLESFCQLEGFEPLTESYKLISKKNFIPSSVCSNLSFDRLRHPGSNIELASGFSTDMYSESEIGDYLTSNLRFRCLKDFKHFNFAYQHASGSAQPSSDELKLLVSYVLKKYRPASIAVVDLRLESHGFVNGHPLTFYCDNNRALFRHHNRSPEFISLDEKSKLQSIQHLAQIWVSPTKKSPLLRSVLVKSIQSEEEIVRDIRIGEMVLKKPLPISYLRIRSPDHSPPIIANLDKFILLVHKHSTSREMVHYHFHCSAGKGRTTLFLALLDILQSCTNFSLEVILHRQKLLNGYDLKHTPNKHSYKSSLITQRMEFIHKFYNYCQKVNPLSLPQLNSTDLFSAFYVKK